jgi:diaminopimelate decarboxylase
MPASSSREVIYVKEGEAKNFVIVDAAMNDLIRPTLYDAWHEIQPVVRPPRRAAHPGRCRRPRLRDRRLSGHDRDLPRPKPGDLIWRRHRRRLWRGAGRHLQRVCWSRKCWSTATVPRHPPAPSYDALIGLDSCPDWLA